MDNHPETNVKQAVPFFAVASMNESIHFYVDGLGFRMTNHWTVDGRLRWCWLEIGNAALMLQEYLEGDHGFTAAQGKLGKGVTICYICADALAIYQRAMERGLSPSRPFVGNGMWVTSLVDPDGYRIDFESLTDVPEGTEYTAG